MTLSLFAQYAAVASLFVLATSIVILAIKHKLDGRAFFNNAVLSHLLAQKAQEDMLQTLSEDFESFDKHVEGVPGMKSFNSNLN